MRLRHLMLAGLALLLAGACSEGYDKNAFLAFTEEYGVAGTQDDTPGGGTGTAGSEASGRFRRDTVITLRNNHTSADLNVSLMAWVNVSSIRSAQQQDALLQNGYVQLTRELRLGTAHTLPVGTFVYYGSGTGGSTHIVLRSATGGGENAAVTPTTFSLTLNSPDAVLAYAQPPVSCESVAFYFSRNGEPLTAVPVGDPEAPYAGATRAGGFKTLAQVDVYECSPFRPGLFFNSGGARQDNQFYEGDSITFDFNEQADADGNFAIVTIGATTTTTTDANP